MYASGYRGIKWVDRGLVTEYDYDVTDFIIDNEWHVKDLSSIIGMGVKYLYVSLGVANDTRDRSMELRTHGQEGSKNMGGVMSLSDGGFNEHGTWVLTDADGKIDYHCQALATWSLIQFIIRGWFE